MLKDGAQAFGWWAKPPVVPRISIYVYNVTNADEFLNNGSKPIVDEIGPYVYEWVSHFLHNACIAGNQLYAIGSFKKQKTV